MKCVICKTGETAPGKATLTFEKNGCIIIIKDVDGDICQNWGESYHSAEVTGRLMAMTEAAATNGTEIEVRRYVA